MTVPAPTSSHVVHQPWPSFLNGLDGNSARAFRDFYNFAWRLLTLSPPRALRDLSPQDREDVISEIILHCLKDDARVLRTYSNHGRPFARWLLVVAQCKAVDCIRRLRPPQAGDAPAKDYEQPVADDAPSPEAVAIARKNLERVYRSIREMEPNCQLLLLGSAAGYRPRELACLLGWPATWGKKASDSLRYCRSRLKALLEREGVDWQELVHREALTKGSVE